ncbi:MAG: hypothetical protein UV43_C0029G0002 [Parcubacteria group bacterium GW2011_GWF2_42_7]|nr:MAG: hypothetical protein UV43_C0029G0002 [Parcubacteria group bacterium GW2011_GWF2_42_7]
MKVIIADLKKTEKIAQDLAKKILSAGWREKNKKAVVIGLEGELGGGKTALAQFFAKALGIKEKIQSPTFVIIKKYQIPNKFQTNSKIPACHRLRLRRMAGRQISNFKTFVHIDAYRIKNPKELLALGWKEIISTPQNVVLIEWADRVKKILPQKCVQIKFKVVDDKTRKITI